MSLIAKIQGVACTPQRDWDIKSPGYRHSAPKSFLAVTLQGFKEKKTKRKRQEFAARHTTAEVAPRISLGGPSE
jgi:hypothetical protein